MYAREVAPLDEDDPQALGPYRLQGRLGEGGMGAVYLALTTAGIPVAVKVVRPDLARHPDFRARFRREAELARRVARFCTAEVLDVDVDAKQPYLVTEYIDGPTLTELVTERGPLVGGDLERLAVAVASALTAIHAAGLIHRDLKPSNVMLSASGARVIDFGIARALDSATALTQHTRGIGTPAFMAPEQAMGHPATTASDIFAWGGVLAFAATGRLPFGEGPTPTVLYRAVHDEPDLTGIGPPLRAVVEHAMRKSPAGRPTASELLAHLVGGFPQVAPGGGVPAVPPPPVASQPVPPPPVAPPSWSFPPPAAPVSPPPWSTPPPVPPTRQDTPVTFLASQPGVPSVPGAHPGPAPSGGGRQGPRWSAGLIAAATAAVVVVILAVTVPLVVFGRDAEPGSAGSDSSTGPTSAPDDGVPRSVSGEIVVDGSSTVAPLSEAAAELFQAENPDATVVVGTSGTGGGFEKFCRGETDISDASRPIKEEEIAACEAAGLGYQEFHVANDALTVVVNKENDWVDCLTVDQLRTIWDQGSTVNNWNQVDPSFPDVPLDLFAPGADSGTFGYFTDEINGEEGRSRTDYEATENDNIIVQGVSGARGGLGYFGLSYYEENADSLKALEIDGADGCIAPSVGTAQDGTYTPLSRPLFIYVSSDGIAKPQVDAFVDFYLHNTTAIAEAASFVPLSAEQAAQVQASFDTFRSQNPPPTPRPPGS